MGDLTTELMECLEDLRDAASLQAGDVLIVGASTSELLGQRIGKATSLETGEKVVQTCLAFAENTGCSVAFQCCEHLNRAVVVERSLAKQRGWREVKAIPVPGAGGAVAAKAYFELPGACLVETIEADAGIDIGDTFIGMHIRRVAVPIRGRRKEIGEAHVTMAKSRSPLIGGTRAVYDVEEARRRVYPANESAESGLDTGAEENSSTCD